ncbi:MAG: tRNA (adenosine(37)-N6)-threonylcarbamoyltransferase complex ATPase subunit type 1 TsaE [Gammaproteobacteria bacterium]
MISLARYVPDGQAMEELGQCLSGSAKRPGVIYLRGDLGTGKTTLVRGLLRGFGYYGKVKSPTYTLVEPYPIDDLTIYHLDLYRLGSPEELEWIGIRDLLGESALLLVEWPEQGDGVLPPADLVISLAYQDQGRELHIQALTAAGELMIAACLHRDTSMLLGDR